MKAITSIRRAIATIVLTAGLAYPACAAVCPKGIGGCTSPGRCFLFTDTDGNALCDYTSRTGSQIQADPVTSSTAAPVQVTTAPAPVSPITPPILSPDTTTAGIQNTSSGGFFDVIHLSVPLAGIILFLLFTGIFFAVIRTGLPGIQGKRTLAALALAAFFGLGFSLIITSILAGDAIAGTMYALIYMGAGTLLVAYLWHRGVMTRHIVLGAAAVGTLAGFIFLAPIMPMELGGIINVITGASVLTVSIIVICTVIALTVILGRTFCGSICPVGSLQELAYAVPVKKIVFQQTEIFNRIRLAIFVATVIAALCFVDIMAFTGLYDLFSLTLSAGLVAAAGILLLSVFLYRPVCRIICPFGVIFSLLAEFSWFRLRRTETCTNCKRCERACPTATAGRLAHTGECYLCGRCTDACPVSTAIDYRH